MANDCGRQRRSRMRIQLLQAVLFTLTRCTRGAAPAQITSEELQELECKAGIGHGCAKPEPFFQLERKLKVAICPNNSPRVMDVVLKEGLLAHPMVELVHTNQAREADYIIHVALRAAELKQEGTICPKPDPKRTLVVDESDDSVTTFEPADWLSKATKMTAFSGIAVPKYRALFKRSFVWKDTSQFTKSQFLGFRIHNTEQPSHFPIQYPIRQRFIPDVYPSWTARKLEMVNMLRPEASLRRTSKGGGREKAKTWMEEYVRSHGITAYQSGPASEGKRGQADHTYFDTLRGSKIIVTANPSFWEGDYRTGESLVSGGMVMLDYMWAPWAYPVIDQWHMVSYDLSNKTDFMSKLDYYHNHMDEARAIAARGAYHAQRYMSGVTVVDYLLCTGEYLNNVKTDYIRTGPEVMRDFGRMYAGRQPQELYPD